MKRLNVAIIIFFCLFVMLIFIPANNPVKLYSSNMDDNLVLELRSIVRLSSSGILNGKEVIGVNLITMPGKYEFITGSQNGSSVSFTILPFNINDLKLIAISSLFVSVIFLYFKELYGFNIFKFNKESNNKIRQIKLESKLYYYIHFLFFLTIIVTYVGLNAIRILVIKWFIIPLILLLIFSYLHYINYKLNVIRKLKKILIIGILSGFVLIIYFMFELRIYDFHLGLFFITGIVYSIILFPVFYFIKFEDIIQSEKSNYNKMSRLIISCYLKTFFVPLLLIILWFIINFIGLLIFGGPGGF